MIPQWWSWLLMAIGVTGLFLAGSKNKTGWLIGIGAQVLWIAYGLATRQYGFLVSALAYGGVYTRNYLRWRAEQRRALSALSEPPDGWILCTGHGVPVGVVTGHDETTLIVETQGFVRVSTGGAS